MRHKAATESASINIYLEDLATENHLVIFFTSNTQHNTPCSDKHKWWQTQGFHSVRWDWEEKRCRIEVLGEHLMKTEGLVLKIPMLPYMYIIVYIYICTESPRNSSLSSIVRVKVDPPCGMMKVLTAYTKTCDLLSLQVGIFLTQTRPGCIFAWSTTRKWMIVFGS